MMYFAIFALGLAVILLLFRVVRGQSVAIASIGDLEGQTIPVDLAAFRNLMDPADEAYLRSRLDRGEFRRIKRMRAIAATEYVGRVAHNAAILLRLGEMARGSTDPHTVAEAQRLVNGAIRVRLYAFVLTCTLYLEVVFPVTPTSPLRFVTAYQELVNRVTNLTRLQQPAYAGRVAAVL